jgi:hypothetical protein
MDIYMDIYIHRYIYVYIYIHVCVHIYTYIYIYKRHIRWKKPEFETQYPAKPYSIEALFRHVPLFPVTRREQSCNRAATELQQRSLILLRLCSGTCLHQMHSPLPSSLRPLTYADVCWRMPRCADVCWRMHSPLPSSLRPHTLVA